MIVSLKILGCSLLLAAMQILPAWSAPATTATTAPGGAGYASPQDAVAALRQALAAKDRDQLRVIFGPHVADIINPDPVQATNEFTTVAHGIDASHQILNAGEGRMLLEYGQDETLFPVPLVQRGAQWFFDTAAGEEEIVNRRIGRNELAVLDVLRTCVQAQREYASADRNGDEVLEYAQRFASAPGKKDGLYWPPDLDGTISPLGPLVAEAGAEGYKKTQNNERQPFHGYYFRILSRQGKHTPGGAYNYVINGHMIGGFAFVAWPAEYDETGIMTFIVNQQGRIYQKDLGKSTARIAERMNVYDPDKSWSVSLD